jgi:hypothetical protein
MSRETRRASRHEQDTVTATDNRPSGGREPLKAIDLLRMSGGVGKFRRSMLYNVECETWLKEATGSRYRPPPWSTSQEREDYLRVEIQKSRQQKTRSRNTMRTSSRDNQSCETVARAGRA